MAKLRTHDPTTLAVLFVDRDSICAKSVVEKEARYFYAPGTTLRAAQPTWKTWGNCNVDPSPIEPGCHLLQSHKVDIAQSLVEVGGFPVHL